MLQLLLAEFQLLCPPPGHRTGPGADAYAWCGPGRRWRPPAFPGFSGAAPPGFPGFVFAGRPVLPGASPWYRTRRETRHPARTAWAASPGPHSSRSAMAALRTRDARYASPTNQGSKGRHSWRSTWPMEKSDLFRSVRASPQVQQQDQRTGDQRRRKQSVVLEERQSLVDRLGCGDADGSARNRKDQGRGSRPGASGLSRSWPSSETTQAMKSSSGRLRSSIASNITRKLAGIAVAMRGEPQTQGGNDAAEQVIQEIAQMGDVGLREVDQRRPRRPRKQ